MVELLSVRGLEAGYGAVQVLFGVDLDIGAGEVVALLGRNGMGKTTTVRAITASLPSRGTIRFAGTEIAGLADYQVARLGYGLVPEGRRIFPNLTVRENLHATAANRTNAADPWTIARVYALFPRLGERQGNMGNQLSGGEQQMLAIGRALMTNPRLLILDEATEGLAPLIRREIWQCVLRLKSAGQSILLIDKNLKAVLKLADRSFILSKGRTIWSGSTAELRGRPDIVNRHIALSH